MNYFLHYDNNNPLFIGGMHHGQKHCVRLNERYCRIAVWPDIKSEELLRPSRFMMPSDKPVDVYNYIEQRFHANGRIFRIFVNEFLDADSAFMLLMSTCAASPSLLKRIKDLEEENRTLKNLIALISSS